MGSCNSQPLTIEELSQRKTRDIEKCCQKLKKSFRRHLKCHPESKTWLFRFKYKEFKDLDILDEIKSLLNKDLYNTCFKCIRIGRVYGSTETYEATIVIDTLPSYS